MPKLELYLSKIVKYGLYAILLTPLAFWPKALFPFLTPKFILFQILVEIVFAAWLILFIKRGFTRIWADLHGNYIVLALLLFFAVSFISAIFGIDFSRSFWGIGPRMTGLFAELHFLAWFLVLISVFKRGLTQSQARINADNQREFANNPCISAISYINFSFFVALIVAATSFYQNSAWGLSLGYGIFNNPTFVAPYLIFHFFWGLYQAINLKYNVRNRVSNIKSWFFGAGTAFLLFVILFAQIRGAILGLLIGIFVLGISLILNNVLGRRSRIILSAFYVLLIAGLVAFWQLRDNQFIQSFSPIKRVTGISLSETTVQTRLLAWQVALEGFKETPLFGTGPENFNYLFNKHYNPRFLKFGGGGFGETWFDKPHNAFLETLSEAGIIGSLAYVFIWAVVSLALYKLFRRGEKFLSLILTSTFIAYFGAVFFSFDSFGSWFGLFLFLAFLASYSDSNLQIHSNSTNKFVEFVYIRRLGLLIVLMATLFLTYLNYSIWRANLADAEALRTFPRDPSSGLILFDKSFSRFSPYKDEYQLDMISSVAGAIQKNVKLPNWEEMINYMLEKADEMVKAHPNNAAYYTDMVKIYNILGILGRDPKILAQAETFGKKSLELSPNRQETLFYLTQTALLEGKNKTAVALAQQAVDFDPTIRQSHWYLGLAYVANGQIQEGTAEIKKALDLGYVPQNKAEKEILTKLGL